jgi:hypothetical protein
MRVINLFEEKIMMRRLCFSVVLFLGLSSNIFSLQEHDTSLVYPYSGSIYDFIGNKPRLADEFYTIIPGLALPSYTFWDNRPIGLFSNFGTRWLSKAHSPADDIYEYHGLGIDMMIGPGFRTVLGEKQIFRYSVGFEAAFETMSYRTRTNDNTYSFAFIDLGIGGNMGLKLDITDILNIVFGADMFITFVDCAVDGNDYASKWSFNPIIGIKPYISIGFNAYTENGRYYIGKLPRI